ncbi:outer membrane lipoprotein carrier protein LolA [Oryzifoliimicrobium ureilyticus]|uniref:outer membrane lipoprotein carrier protein LolA n=1 Tax=Oryzifoliimicrobium ureilyticus TaxID=3113724 RepID=UPI00307611D6
MSSSATAFHRIVLSRRMVLGAMAGAAASTMISAGTVQAQAAAPSNAAAQQIANHFSAVTTMQGEFVQFGPRGEQTDGKFYIERPGKLRFNYNDPSPIRVISDGRNVAIGNLKMKTWDLYPLSKTPLSLLLAQKIDLSDGSVKSVKQEPDLTTIVLGNKTIFGTSTITMMFDSKTYDLRQWTITDNQGKDTSVMVTNVKTGVQFDDRVFRVPYESIPGTPAYRD